MSEKTLLRCQVAVAVFAVVVVILVTGLGFAGVIR